ncbi:MAG: efflux RND transporter periplasmic adaptor subunit [Gammaproteobacteria bacterium]|nr:efflux RND transporter periplasmic adaptor subunit [Gammaproteobacteria bacterium]
MNKKIWFLALFLLLTGVVAGVLVQRYVASITMSSPEEMGDKKVLFYRHPMNPSITSDKPAKDEMDMDYIPVYEGEETGADVPAVSISPQVVNNMGVRTARVERVPFAQTINGVGYISVDEGRLQHVHVRSEGWVEGVRVKFAGQRVRAGEILFEIYAPKLLSTQQEYLQALAAGDPMLRRAARTRLKALGVAEAEIRQLETTRKTRRAVSFYAPADGVVTALNIRRGMYLEPDTEAVTLADLSSVWVQVEVFPQQAALLSVGQEAEVRSADVPGKSWRGKVEYLYPDIDPVTRTLKARLRFNNPDEILKPNMYAEVRIAAGAAREALTIPREALIRTGAEQRVIVVLGAGKFEPRVVQAGAESGERIEIIVGLDEGETVVTSGQFLIDSEASLKAALTRLSGETP